MPRRPLFPPRRLDRVKQSRADTTPLFKPGRGTRGEQVTNYCVEKAEKVACTGFHNLMYAPRLA